MRGAIPPLLQYAFMAWFSLKAQGQLYLTFIIIHYNYFNNYCTNKLQQKDSIFSVLCITVMNKKQTRAGLGVSVTPGNSLSANC
jgi:hypothetical protein